MLYSISGYDRPCNDCTQHFQHIGPFLSSLPNLHTFQVFHAKEDRKTEIRNGFQSVILRRIRTLIIPEHCSGILKCCPQVTKVWCNYGDGKKLVEVIRKYCSFQGEKTHSRLAQKQLEFEPSQYPVLGMKSASMRIMYKTTTAKFRFNVSLHALDITVIYLMNTLHLLVVVFDPVFMDITVIYFMNTLHLLVVVFDPVFMDITVILSGHHTSDRHLLSDTSNISAIFCSIHTRIGT